MIKCIVIDDEPLAQDLLVSNLKKIPDIETVAVFDNAFDAMSFIKTKEVDLVFCDIQMPDMNGISLLKSLANPPLFVFVTGNPEYAVEGFELNVLDYILKPFDVERLAKTINKAQAFLNYGNSTAKDFMVIKDRSLLMITPYKEVFFIKGNKDYVFIETLEKNYHVYKKLIEMESSLSNAKQFVRVHKSYIVNLDFAKRVEGNFIIMKGSIEKIPIGKQYRSELYRALGISGND
ncbi:LytR/AlgR family response regulator transcription factor [Sphingobacterium multivorum]|uniref:LytR/AlgR family response regulator transcription factor n=1 Tax=Sphingobacterium multivorum TaxID=28454 RepID=UPI0028B0F4B9|nr:LytTR family DNA-binding domain-containing protein [Sphingobacterium multivorum]